MGMTAEQAFQQAYALSKGYTDKSLEGAGGLKGQDGKSAYQIAVDNGFIGSEEQWLESLKGADGINGSDGQDGFSPIITENPNNDDKTYKLDITDVNGTRTTPNLRGKDGSGSGGSDTTDYDELDNKPKINNVVVEGDKSLHDYGIQPEGDYATTDDLQEYTLIEDAGVELVLRVDPQTYVMELELKNAHGQVISSQDFDFPIETAFVNVHYDKETNEITFTLQNGTETEPIDISDIIRGLVPDERTIAGLNLKADISVEDLKEALGIIEPVNPLVFDTKREMDDWFLESENVENLKEGQTIYIKEEGASSYWWDGTALHKLKSGEGKPNTKDDDGYVTKGQDHPNQVWGTDDEGNPDWRDAPQGKDGKSAYDIAVDEGFQGDKEQWLESLKGENGRSITSIRTDEDNNVWVTFDDDDEDVNIGQLNINVQADFLTEDGFGKLRYYQGKLEYWNDDLQKWVETSVTPENVYILQMTPQPMQYMMGIYDHNIQRYKLKWKESADTVIEGQVAVIVEKVVIRRKKDSAPENQDDGKLVTTINRADFGAHEWEWYVDNSFIPTLDEVWHYKAFPISTLGFTNYLPENETGGIKAKDYELYGMIIDQNESDPPHMIKQIEDNAKFRSVYMDYAADRFNWGDWRYKEAFFMYFRTCMLKYDGTVGYYLDPDDETLREDGQPSDVSNENYDGNAMVEWCRGNGERIWWSLEDNGDGTGTFLVCNKKLDERFHCYSNIDSKNNEIDHFYTPMYPGSLINGRIRSLSGKTPISIQTTQQEIEYALANNPDSNNVMWFTEVTSDRKLIDLLLLLIGGSTDTQTVFGSGNNNSYVTAANAGVKTTGTMDKKGLFWGDTTKKVGVKCFGMEHWFGNQWRRIAGWICDNGVQKVKMTYGTADGSMVEGYNLTGDGYIEIPNTTPSGISTNYISSAVFTENGIMPKVASGTATTYYTDGLWFDNLKVAYASVGGSSADEFLVGALCADLFHDAYYTRWSFTTALSCKPLLSTQKSDQNLHMEVE